MRWRRRCSVGPHRLGGHRRGAVPALPPGARPPGRRGRPGSGSTARWSSWAPSACCVVLVRARGDGRRGGRRERAGVLGGRTDDAGRGTPLGSRQLLPPVPSLGTSFALERRSATADRSKVWPGSSAPRCSSVGLVGVRDRRALATRTSSRRADAVRCRAGTTRSPWRTRTADAVVAALARGAPTSWPSGSGAALQAQGGDLDVRGPSGSVIADPVAYRAVKGSDRGLSSRTVSGQAPARAALGRRLGRRLGVTIGDTVVLKGRRGDVPLAVTGWFINPGQDDLDLGILVSDDTLHALAPQDCDPSGDQGSRAASRLREPESSLDLALPRPAVLERLQEIAPDLGPVGPPSVIENLAEVGATPWFLAGFLALIGGAGLAHALIVGVRRRRYDLAVVRAHRPAARPGSSRGHVGGRRHGRDRRGPGTRGRVAGRPSDLGAGRHRHRRHRPGAGTGRGARRWRPPSPSVWAWSCRS